MLGQVLDHPGLVELGEVVAEQLGELGILLKSQCCPSFLPVNDWLHD